MEGGVKERETLSVVTRRLSLCYFSKMKHCVAQRAVRDVETKKGQLKSCHLRWQILMENGNHLRDLKSESESRRKR